MSWQISLEFNNLVLQKHLFTLLRLEAVFSIQWAKGGSFNSFWNTVQECVCGLIRTHNVVDFFVMPGKPLGCLMRDSASCARRLEKLEPCECLCVVSYGLQPLFDNIIQT